MSKRISHSSRRDSGSSPEDGSSRMAILQRNSTKLVHADWQKFGEIFQGLKSSTTKNTHENTHFVLPINAMPKQSRRFMPPDKLCPYSFALDIKFNFCSKWFASNWTCFGVKPRKRPKNHK